MISAIRQRFPLVRRESCRFGRASVICCSLRFYLPSPVKQKRGLRRRPWIKWCQAAQSPRRHAAPAGAPIAGFTGLVYLEQSGYQPLPVGPYDWTVATPGCGTIALDLAPFTLQSGTALTLLIVGGGNQPLTSVLLVDRGGQSFSYLPIIFKP